MADDSASPSQISNLKSEIPKRRSFRRWFRFSLGTLFIVLTIVCLWLGWYVNRAQRQQRAVEVLQSVGGVVAYAYQTRGLDETQPPGPTWLRERIGIDYFDDAVMVFFGPLSERAPVRPLADENLAELRHLPKLRMVFLDGVFGRPTTDRGCVHLGRLSNLQELELRKSQISDDGLAHLARLPNLNSLKLDDCQITNKGLEHLEFHKKIQTLGLAGTKVDDEGVLSLVKLPGLKSLDLGRTRLTDRGLSVVAAIPLEELSIGGTQVTDAGLAHLRNHATLKYVLMPNADVTDEGVRHLTTIPNLECVDLEGTRITDACLADLARCQTLTMLGLWGTHLSPEAAARLKKALPGRVISTPFD